jgi:hypothetical protein
MKNPISPEDPRSQKTGGRGGSRGPHIVVARPSPGRGPALAAPPWREEAPAILSASPLAYIYPLTT